MVRTLLVVAMLLSACGGSADVASDELEPTTTSGSDTSAPTTSTPAAGSASPDTTAAATTSSVAANGCAHVIDGEIAWQGEAATVSATVRSADTGWDKYADAWVVRLTDGTVLGIRELAHPHENEQPFTRSLTGVEIPTDAGEVVLAARDSVAGWCGDTFTLAVPDRT